MIRCLMVVSLVATWMALAPSYGAAMEPLAVAADFEGGSVRAVEIDQEVRSVRFMPGGDPARGWPCWWYFRIDGITPGETITLRLQGSTAALEKQKPLSAVWAMPAQATYSTDGVNWLQPEPGRRDGERMTYTLMPDARSVYIAWGPPYTPSTAAKFVSEISKQSPYATAAELCRSREGRPVPMLQVQEGDVAVGPIPQPPSRSRAAS